MVRPVSGKWASDIGSRRGLPRDVRARTVPALLAHRASMRPDHMAIVPPSGPRDGLTYQQLDRYSDEIAALLRHELGIGHGERIAWILDNDSSADALALYHGILKAGAVNVPLNTRLAPREIRWSLDHAECSAVFVTDGYELDHADLSTSPIPVISIDGSGNDDLPALRRRVAANTDPAPDTDHAANADTATQPTEDDLAVILYTSGTTGRPKGVEHTHASSIAAGMAWADCFRLGTDDVLASPFPVFSGAALHFNGLSSLFAGGAFVLDGTNAAASLRRIPELGVTVYVAVPAIYAFWLNSEELDTADLTSLRILDYGGSAMARNHILTLNEKLPGVDLMQTYGLTEAGPGGTYLPAEWAISRLGSIGNRAAGRDSQIRVVDDGGADVAADQVGELLFRGPSVMRGYHRDAEATAQVMSDGWLRSGDLVRFDGDGFIHFVDRKKDLIVRGGYNISSHEIESVLLEHEAVLEAAAHGVPHPSLGEDVHASVVLRHGHSTNEAELIAHCRRLIADFKCPRRIHFLDELPRNAAGKVMKYQLSGEPTKERSQP